MSVDEPTRQLVGRGPARRFERLLRQLPRYLESAFVVPDDCGLLIDGSIAEGLGNSGSDIDVSVVVDGDEPVPQGAFVGLYDSDGAAWRVEVRYRSVASLEKLAGSLKEVEVGTKLGARILANYHRLAHGHPLRRSPALDHALRQFDTQGLCTIAAQHHRLLAQDAMRRSRAALWLGRDRAAVGHARELVIYACQAWCAQRGETYPSAKWLPLLLARAGMTQERITRFSALVLGRLPVSDRDVVLAALAFAAQLGVQTAESDVEPALSVAVAPGVVVWESGELYLIAAGRDVYQLNADAAGLWRSQFTNASRAIDAPEALSDSQRSLLGELHAHGLVTARMNRGTWEWTEATRLFVGHEETPIVTARGVVFTQPSAAPVRWVPIAARRLAEAGTQLVYESIRVESWLVDAFGAYESEQWAVLTNAAHQVVRQSCAMLLCSVGVTGVPLERAADQLRSSGAYPELALAAERILARVASCRVDAEQLQRAATAFRRSLPAALLDPVFVGIYERASAYLHALRVAAQWKTLGGMVGVRIPQLELDAVADDEYALIAGTGNTRFGMKGEALDALLTSTADPPRHERSARTGEPQELKRAR